jgi:hypothetical protein
VDTVGNNIQNICVDRLSLELASFLSLIEDIRGELPLGIELP